MQLTGAQIKLIKKSWEIFRVIDPVTIGEVFYGKLFLQHPALEKLFSTSMNEQYKKLVDMLSVIVSRLEKLDELTNDINNMAVRHVQYGVKPKHYEYVGEALLWTLKRGLANDWNAETEEAWMACYYILASTMINAAESK